MTHLCSLAPFCVSPVWFLTYHRPSSSHAACLSFPSFFCLDLGFLVCLFGVCWLVFGIICLCGVCWLVFGIILNIIRWLCGVTVSCVRCTLACVIICAFLFLFIGHLCCLYFSRCCCLMFLSMLVNLWV